MSRVVRELDLEPDPIELARRLADGEGLVVFGARGHAVYVACDPVQTSRDLDPEPGFPRCSRADDLGRTPRWIGLVPYESRRDLERRTQDTRAAPHLVRPLWLRYRAVLEVTDRVRVVGDDAPAVDQLTRRAMRSSLDRRPVALGLAEPIEPAECHERRICQALDLIARGDIYQVNLARRLLFRVQGSPLELLAALSGPELPAYPLALATPDLDVVGLSPELFLELDANGRVLTTPIKGTRPRTFDAHRDRALARDLEESSKERAELTMILDVERNDLGRVATTGSVHLIATPRVECHGPVLHRLATITAQVKPGIDRCDLLRVMLPSGSVTGAPKIRAMEVIAELEAHRRGAYTGAYGAVCHDGGLLLSMAIRTLTVRSGVGHYFTGGGIVADSDPRSEVEETVWKARQLLDLARSAASA